MTPVTGVAAAVMLAWRSGSARVPARAAPRRESLRGLLGVSGRQGRTGEKRARRWCANCRKNSASPSTRPGRGSAASSPIRTQGFTCASSASARGTAILHRSSTAPSPGLKAGAAASVAPILPANGPILRALALPPGLCAERMPKSEAWRRNCAAGNALANGLRLIQVRDKTLAPAQRTRLRAWS
jgi:hypothetical protein